jgi:outer membrane protein assembly factor BamB
MRTSKYSGFLLLLAAFLLGGTLGAAAQSIGVSPGSNHPSSTTNVNGTAFGTSEVVDIYFDTTDEELAVTNSSGSFASTPIAVSASALPGTHYITAIGRHSGLAAQGKFTVQTNWAQFHYGVQQKGYNPYENVLSTETVTTPPSGASPRTVEGLDLAWVFPVNSPSSPTVFGKNVYLGADGAVYAINAASGAQVWSKPTTNLLAGQFWALPVTSKFVYAADQGGNVYAFATSNGAPGWTRTLNPIFDSGPMVANGAVYIGDTNGFVYALNALTGAPLWKKSIGTNDSYLPSYADGVVFVTSPAGTITAFNAVTGFQNWQASVSPAPRTSIAVANGELFYGDTGNNICARRANQGAVLWCTATGAPVVGSTPAYANGIVYVGSTDHSLYALDAATGTVRWSAATGNDIESAPAVANGVVYAGSNDGNAYAYDALRGTRLWFAALSHSSSIEVESPAVVNGMVFDTTYSNGLYAFALSAGNNQAYRRNPKPPAISSLHPNFNLSPWKHAARAPADAQ